jgi:hypothetical protein
VSFIPLPNTSDEAGPYVLSASIRDYSGVESAMLHYSFDNSVFVTQPMMRDTGSSWVATFGGYPAGTTFYYYLTAADSADSHNVATTPIDSFSVMGVIFADDVESGEGLWTSGALQTGWANQWHISATRSHSGGHAWKFGDTGAGTYSIHSYGGLVTPAFYLRGQATLSFWQWIRAERSPLYPDSAYDGGAVDILVDNGTWQQLTGLNPAYNKVSRCTRGSGNAYTGPFSFRTPVFSDSIDWTPVSVTLDAYAGHTVQFRFRFGSDSTNSREGWYVDDITLFGLPPAPQVPNTVTDLVMIATGDHVQMTWTGTGAAWYKVFSAAASEGPFSTLEGTTAATTYQIPANSDKRFFMIVASTTP